MTKDTTAELVRLKQHIDKAKTEVARLEGQIQQLEKQRASEFGVSTDDEAEAYVKELEADVQRLEAEISEGLATIKDELNW